MEKKSYFDQNCRNSAFWETAFSLGSEIIIYQLISYMTEHGSAKAGRARHYSAAQYISVNVIIVHTVSWNNNPAVTSVHHRELVSCSSCQKVCCYTVPARQHLVTSLILFPCQTPSRAKLGNETLSEPGRLNRM